MRLALICVLAALGVAACTSNPTTPSSSAPYSQVDLLVGTGAEAAIGSPLAVAYTGWLYDPTKTDGRGLQFDASAPDNPLKFTVGNQQVIAGFDRGVVGMKVGGIRRLVIPPSLGYGNSRNNSIPAYATLVFDVELLAIESGS